jgi:ketosteroid isomerase-like protein
MAMSRRILLVGAAAIGLAVACRSATNRSDAAEVAHLLNTDREWGKLAATSKNVDSVVAYWTDDARVLLTGQPVISGKSAIREMVAGTMKIPGFRVTWTPDSAVVSRSGDLGYTYGTNEFTVPDSTGKLVTTPGRYLTVWRKDTDGRWRCVQDISNPAPAAAGPA